MGRTGVGTLCLWLCAVVCLVHGQDLVNVAPNKTYSQSSTYSSQRSDSMAANGDTSQYFPANCIHTYQSPSPSWFEVDLGRTYPVYNITLWARPNWERRLNSSIITVDNQTCASITSFPTDTREKTVTCPSVMYGQRVRITRQLFQELVGDDMTLNLCEIQIWVPREVSECEAGRYGTSCDMNCNDHCGKGPGKNFCYQSSGYCYDDCVSGWYGDQCSTTCSPGCQNTACDRQSGHCSPCNTGYEGDMCQECKDTHYKNSSEMCVQCSANCQSQSCEDATGKCKGCAAGHYGDTCGMLCPKCQRCDQESGVCTACPLNSHLQLPNCTECQDGYYKNSDTCAPCSTDCWAQSCDQKNGTCHGCVDGRYGDTCTRVCPTANCRQCHQTTGQCEECAQNNNLQPPDCTDCHDGYYKRSDNTGCDACRGTCQSGTVCDKTTGFCLLCPPGKQGYFCEQDDKDSDSTVSTTVFAGSLVGVGLAVLIIGAGINIVIMWICRSRRSDQSGNATDKTEVTAATAVPANRGQSTAVFQGVTDQEGQYERVGDIPMTTKHVHPGTSTHPDTTAHVTEADNPYDRPTEQYSNTGELHIYDPIA